VSRLVDVPTVVVTGARGAGKTTWLAHALDARPAAERRAVLLTEVGAASLDPRRNVTVAAAEPGCICCVGQVSLRIALTRLLRESMPARLYLELGEPAHLGASLRTLRNPWLAPVLTLVEVVGVVDAADAVHPAPDAAWLGQLTALRIRNDPDGAWAARVAALRPTLPLLD
jgi:G3E family GTPase